MEIEFRYNIDKEGHDLNSPWRVDEMYAFIGDTEVGKIRYAYFDRHRIKRFKTIYHYLRYMGGWCIFDQEKYFTTPFKKFPLDELQSFAQSVGLQMRNYMAGKPDTKEECLKVIYDYIPRVEKLHRNEFEGYKKRLMMKPFVEWVWVEDEYQRQGIGTKLYLEAARVLAERKLRLHASTLQSDEAKGAWKKLEELGMVRTYKGRRLISLK